MANTVIQLKKSGTPAATPATLANGELAINYADGKLFYKDTLGNIQEISGGGGGPFFGSINVAGTLVVPDIPGDILTINSGNNIELTPDTINDSYTITANLKPAFDVANAAFTSANNVAPQVTPAFNVANAAFAKANAALANTSGVSFAGDLYFPSGSIGINTASPVDKLHVNSAVSIGYSYSAYYWQPSQGDKVLKLSSGTSPTTGTGTVITLGGRYSTSSFDQTTWGAIGGFKENAIDSDGDGYLALFTNKETVGGATERMRITSTGNVGIGTSNPVYKLDVQGDARITGNLTLGDATTDTVTVNAANFNLANNVSFDSGTLFIDSQNNRVGISTTSPNSPLTVGGSASILGTTLNIGDGTTSWITNSIVFKDHADGQYWGYINKYGLDSTPQNTLELYLPGISYTSAIRLRTGQAGSVQFWTNETERMRITSGGNVGIGTSAPTSKLHVNGTANLVGQIYINNAIANTARVTIDTTAQPGIDIYRSDIAANYSAIRFRDQTNAGTYGLVGFDSGGLRLDGSAGTIYFSTSATERMRIDSSGNIGIGTTSPSIYSNYKTITLNGATGGGAEIDLKVNDTLCGYIEATSSLVKFNAEGSRVFQWVGNGVERMRITSAGNVGIGTSSPSANLHVIGTANVSSTIYTRDIEAPFYSLYNEGAGAYVGIKGNYLRFGGVSEFMRIANTSGYVGIGTTTPGATLDIKNDTLSAKILQLTGNSTYLHYFSTETNSLGTNGNRLKLQTQSGTGEFIYATNVGTRFIIDANGNVGIGTTYAGEKLQVAGNIYSTGYIYSDSYAAFTEYRIRNSENNKLTWSSGLLTLQSAANTNILLSAGMSERMRIDATGNVQINSTTALGKLHVCLENSFSSTKMVSGNVNDVLVVTAPFASTPETTSGQNAKWGIRFGGYGDNTFGNNKSAAVYAVSEDVLGYNRVVGLAFHTSPQDLDHRERMRINSAGNVGIDITSPSEKLHVANGSILLDRTYYLKSRDDQGTVRQLIGTSADGAVNVRGFRGTSMIDGVNGATYLYDSGGVGTQRLSVTATGVGIGGILAAAEKLEVNGNIKANSYIMVNSAMAPITVITATTTDQIVDSFTTSTWRSAQYNITMTAGTDYHTTQISLIHDGTNAYMTEYGTLSTANNLGTFSATVSGSTVRLNVVPTFANTSINMLRTTNK